MVRSGCIRAPLSLLSLVILCAACITTEPLLVDFSPVTTSAPDQVERCAVTVSSVTDARRSKDDLGMLGPRVVEGQDVIPWINRALQTLTNLAPNMATSKDDLSGLKRVNVQVSLNQLYVHSLLSSFGGNIHLNVQYRLNQELPKSQQYRGSDTSVNWFGSGESVSDLLNDILEGLLVRMRSDIAQLCRGGT